MRLGWLSDLSRDERNTYFACFGGLALDAMDTTVYALVMPVLIALVGISRPQAGVLASLALIGSGVGGWLAGGMADRFGRVRVLQLTVLWTAVFTFLAAFMSDFWGFAFVRTMQGLGYGGEAAVGGVLVSEVVAPHLRGRVAASVQSGYAVGYALSVLAFPIIFQLAPEAIAWRVFFALGLLPAIFIFFIRRLVPESAIFVDAQKLAAKQARPNPLWGIFAREHLRTTVIATVMSTGIFGGAYTLITWLPTYLRTALNLSVTSTSGYLAVNILGSFVGPFCFGWLADRIGRRFSFMLFLVLQAINVTVYMTAPIGPAATVVLGFFLGAFQGGLASGMLPSFAELFPTQVRAAGEGFCLSGGRGFGSVVPAIVGVLVTLMPLGSAMGMGAIASYIVAIAAALMLPETSGARLRTG
jgi:MFS family permease